MLTLSLPETKSDIFVSFIAQFFAHLISATSLYPISLTTFLLFQ